MDLYEKTLNQKYAFNGRIINVRVDEIELPDGSHSTREVIEHNGGVCVAALTDNNELIFVRQYRYPYGEVVLELPAGKLEKGENPFEAGKRELREEAGVTADNYRFMGKLYPTPGYCGEIIHLYLATGLHEVGQQLDPDEYLDVERIPLDRAVDMVMNNEIPDSKTQVLILKARLSRPSRLSEDSVLS